MALRHTCDFCSDFLTGRDLQIHIEPGHQLRSRSDGPDICNNCFRELSNKWGSYSNLRRSSRYPLPSPTKLKKKGVCDYCGREKRCFTNRGAFIAPRVVATTCQECVDLFYEQIRVTVDVPRALAEKRRRRLRFRRKLKTYAVAAIVLAMFWAYFALRP